MKPILAIDICQNTPWGSGSLVSRFPHLGVLFNLLLKNSLTIAGLIFLFLLLLGGLMFIIGAGSGDPKKTQAAGGLLTTTLIGFAIVLTAYLIIQLIEVITGLNILNSPL